MLSEAFHATESSSFSEFLSRHSPDRLPGARPSYGDHNQGDVAPHGTTIVAASFADGIVMAGDRRATMANLIAQRDVDKVHPADDYSCIGIAGTAGLAAELVRLFQVELEHYEKVEGTVLSADGKANRLATLIRANLGLALQGLPVVPLFGGYDLRLGYGRIFSYDATGGSYEERDFYAVGSGSVFARGALKKLYANDMNENDCVTAAIQAIYDASDDDTATGGPDLPRRIFPVVSVVTGDGYRRLNDETVATITDQVITARMVRPDGPQAPLS